MLGLEADWERHNHMKTRINIFSEMIRNDRKSGFPKSWCTPNHPSHEWPWLSIGSPMVTTGDPLWLTKHPWLKVSDRWPLAVHMLEWMEICGLRPDDISGWTKGLQEPWRFCLCSWFVFLGVFHGLSWRFFSCRFRKKEASRLKVLWITEESGYGCRVIVGTPIWAELLKMTEGRQCTCYGVPQTQHLRQVWLPSGDLTQ